MGYVNKSPATGLSYDSDRRAMQADITRIDRERNDGRPGSVISSDEARLVIPGPLADTGRDGQVLTWDEDRHQPVWASGGGGVVGATFATPSISQSISRGSGMSSIFVDGWTFDTSVTSDQPTGPSLTAASQDFGPNDEGWYGVDLRLRVLFPSGTPAVLYAQYSGYGEPFNFEVPLKTGGAGSPYPGQYGCDVTMSCGSPQWFPAFDADFGGWMALTLKWDDATSSPSITGTHFLVTQFS